MRKSRPLYEGKMSLRKGDEVVVLAGKDKGKRAKVQESLPKQGRVIVDGVNMVTRHKKAQGNSSRAMVKSQLGEIRMPAPLPINKVMLVCPKCSKATRLAREVGTDGKSARKCKKCGGLIDG